MGGHAPFQFENVAVDLGSDPRYSVPHVLPVFGNLSGYRTLVAIYPDLKMGIIIFSNANDDQIVSWWVFALGGGTLLLIAPIAICLRPFHAATANLVNSLRSE